LRTGKIDFSKKRVLITGSGGMVGRSISKLLPDTSNIIRVGRYPKENDCVGCDLRKEIQTIELFRFFKPDYVIHLAARVGGVKANSDHLGEFYEDNIRMNSNVLRAAHICGAKKTLSLLSTCVYPDDATYPLTEDQIHNGPPHSSNYTYAYTKRMLDIQSKAYRDQFNENFISAIPNNLYGQCFSGDTEVLTTNGIKNITNTFLGELIYTLNPETFEIEISKIVAKQEMYSKDFYIFNNKGVDFCVTPEHQIFCSTSTNFQKHSAEWFLNKAGKYFGQVKLAKHKIYKTNNKTEFKIDLSKYIDKYHIINKNGCKDFNHSKSKLFNLLYNNLDFASFCGWYISEGSVHIEITKSNIEKTQIRISQNLNSNPKYYNEISNLLAKMKIPHGKDNFAHYFSSRLFLNFIRDEIGLGCSNKKIPKYYFSNNCSWEERFSLFDSLMKGDGDKNRQRYSTSSKTLMNDFIHLCFLLGIMVSNVSLDNNCYRIYIRKTNPCIKYRNIKKYNSNIFQKFYCITTEKNHIIYAGRNKKFNWVGQCDNFNLDDSHVIPAMIHKMYKANINDDDIILWGNGKPLREFTYSDDLAKILLFLLEEYNGREPINVGNTGEYSIKYIAEIIAKFLNFTGKIIWDTNKPNGQFRKPSCNDNFKKLVSDCGKKLEYTPLENGLKELCKWFINNYPNIRGVK
jgi:nucleoside-diphosphate-sugar epimerase